MASNVAPSISSCTFICLCFLSLSNTIIQNTVLLPPLRLFSWNLVSLKFNGILLNSVNKIFHNWLAAIISSSISSCTLVVYAFLSLSNTVRKKKKKQFLLLLIRLFSSILLSKCQHFRQSERFVHKGLNSKIPIIARFLEPVIINNCLFCATMQKYLAIYSSFPNILPDL